MTSCITVPSQFVRIDCCAVIDRRDSCDDWLELTWNSIRCGVFEEAPRDVLKIEVPDGVWSN